MISQTIPRAMNEEEWKLTSTINVLFLAAEADPFVKIGGLGDYAGSLPPAFLRMDNQFNYNNSIIDIRVALPFHASIQRKDYPLRSIASFSIPSTFGNLPIEILILDHADVPVYFISSPFIPPDEPVYTSDMYKDGLKFTLFSLAALELTRKLQWQPHIIHANDWHTAPAVFALNLRRDQDPFFESTSTLLGVHNLPYLGVGAGPALSAFDLPAVRNTRLPKWARDVPLPLGLLSADHIVTVSQTYAREILTAEFGAGLQKFLRTRKRNISGILNGLDVGRWNPETDGFLKANYSINNLAHRKVNKEALQVEFNLDVDAQRPLLAMVTRIDQQKGVDIVPDAMRLLTCSLKYTGPCWQMIILGTGDPELELYIRRLETEFPKRVRAAFRFDAALSHRIYSGADMLLIPSRYEPCGMTQMIAMRYGCVPLARETGGLIDTICDYDKSVDSTGFLFKIASPLELAQALERALEIFQNPNIWQGIQERGMRMDFSWDKSAHEYFQLYLSLIAKRNQSLN